jgi:hypothetical protein
VLLSRIHNGNSRVEMPLSKYTATHIYAEPLKRLHLKRYLNLYRVNTSFRP